MLTLIISCDSHTNENTLNDILALGGYSGMQTYDKLTGDCLLTLSTKDESQFELRILSTVLHRLHKQNIVFTVTNKEV